MALGQLPAGGKGGGRPRRFTLRCSGHLGLSGTRGCGSSNAEHPLVPGIYLVKKLRRLQLSGWIFVAKLRFGNKLVPLNHFLSLQEGTGGCGSILDFPEGAK